ncbi:MAG: hypothetical protein DWP98_06435 [Bacteroidetes bacterium]|nr:MAG: hypothetical protein DWP98_06435 [Bacteroidota bacterium]MBL1145147.1 hypothetical protein [Bacteroidota bacterium]
MTFKLILLIPLVLFNYSCISQVKTTKIQIQNKEAIKGNTEEMLSKEEVKLLNSLLENSRDTFDFDGKKIAFITGSSGSRILPKTDFFNTCVNPWLEREEKPQIFMVLLNEKKKNKSGGYDAFVLSWVKVFTNRQKQKAIEQLSNN